VRIRRDVERDAAAEVHRRQVAERRLEEKNSALAAQAAELDELRARLGESERPAVDVGDAADDFAALRAELDAVGWSLVLARPERLEIVSKKDGRAVLYPGRFVAERQHRGSQLHRSGTTPTDVLASCRAWTTGARAQGVLDVPAPIRVAKVGAAKAKPSQERPTHQKPVRIREGTHATDWRTR
jgi:hypothetical protein